MASEEVTFFGGPWDAEDHPVPTPPPPILLVPIVNDIYLMDFSDSFPSFPPIFSTALYHLHRDGNGPFYIIDNG